MDTLYQKKFFDNGAHQYKSDLLTNPPVYVQYEVNILLKLIPRNARNIVDFGCGTGRLTIPLLKKGIRVIGVDISDESIKSLKKNIQQLMPERKEHFSSLNHLPNGHVDAIVGTDILHHVSLENTIPEMYNVLLPNGVAIFSEPNALNIAWYVFLGLFINWEAEKGVTHCSWFNLRRIFLQSGFRHVEFSTYGILPPIFFNSVPFLQKINYYLASLPIVKFFSYRLIILARK